LIYRLRSESGVLRVPIRILLVDDRPDSVASLDAEVHKQFPDASSRVVDFDAAEEEIESYYPDVVVLDLAQGLVAEGNNPGLGTRDYIWNKRFCPIVFYTAFPDLLKDDQRLNHPLIKVVTKGTGSEIKVIAYIRELEPGVSAISQASKEIHWALTRALREVAARVFDCTKDTEHIPDTLTRSARRRVAARMDEDLSTRGPNLKSWEQYLCPPTSEHLLTGDVIWKRDGNRGDPSSYRIVLTPSCDLVADGKRQPKAEKVLAATCSSVERLLSEVGLESTSRRDKWKEKLLPLLRQGHGYSCLPVPELPGEFPTMAADFRRLELININQIGNSNKEYVRIASVDSPFRELVAWAYVLNAARPGMPERDFESWVEEIVTAVPVPEKKPEQE
jgi:CTP synthase